MTSTRDVIRARKDKRDTTAEESHAAKHVCKTPHAYRMQKLPYELRHFTFPDLVEHDASGRIGFRDLNERAGAFKDEIAASLVQQFGPAQKNREFAEI